MKKILSIKSLYRVGFGVRFGVGVRAEHVDVNEVDEVDEVEVVKVDNVADVNASLYCMPMPNSFNTFNETFCSLFL